MDHHQQKDFMSSVMSPGQDQQQNSNMFPSFSNNGGAMPQSPNTQLTMGLLNNLMQMQGLETQSLSASSSSNSTSFDSQLLEQQIKLTQLQQLQQLQNQIFQQQIALISGQSSAVLSTSPPLNVPRQSSSGGDQYTGLPTPGPSGEIRPQRPSMDFTPSNALGGYMEPLPHSYMPTTSSTQNNYDTNTNMLQHTRRPLNSNLHRQLQALTTSQHQSQQRPHYHASHHSQDSTSSPNFQPTSPLHSVPVSPMQQPNSMSSPNSFAGSQHGHAYNSGMNTYSQHRFQTPHSAPESMAFHVYSGPIPGGGSAIPGLNLGPAVDDGYGRGRGPILDQDISPLTSPWLGARPTSGSSSMGTSNAAASSSSSSKGGNAGSKRTASSSGDEGGSARKKQSPAIRPTLAMTAVVRKAEEREKERERRSNSPLGPMQKKSLTPPASTNNRLMAEESHNLPISSSASGSGSGSGSGSVSPDPSSRQAQPNTENPASTSNSADVSTSGTIRRRPYRGSKSTSSTPLLRSTQSSAINKAGPKSRAPASAGGGAYGQAIQDSPSPVDLNVGPDEASGNGGHDRSMPPPPLPVSFSRPDSENGNGSGNGDELAGMDGRMDMGMTMDMGMSGTGMNMSNMEMDFNDMMGVVDLNSHLQHRLGVGGSGSGEERGEGMDMHNNDMNMGMGGMHMGGMNMGQMGMGMNGMDDMSFGQHMGEMEIMGMDFAHGQQNDTQGHDRQSQYQQDLSRNHSSMSSTQMQVQAPLTPVTPASIMNLGRLGISGPSTGNNRLSSASAANASTSGPNPPNSNGATKSTTTTRKSTRKDASMSAGKTKDSSGTTTKSGKSSSKKANLVSPGLKPLLPAGSLTPGLDASTPLAASPITPFMNATAGPSNSSLIVGPRKTSHKAAEQKRRDSLKTTFDDLRKLLPPIALPNDADVDPSMITSPLFHPTTPLLPGALPPRGPPKAGGEGPNKGVSKLQLLICGNEYIRLLKARVDRRDDEIEKLRQEVSRLRIVVEEKGEDDGGADEDDIDLEKDLDAIEKTHNSRTAIGSKHGLSTTNTGSSIVGGDDGMDEGDDEDDD